MRGTGWIRERGFLAVLPLAGVAALTGGILLILTGTLIGRGELTVYPLTYIAIVLSTIGSAVFTFGFVTWGRGQAFADPLTGLTNRAGLVHVGEPAIAEALVAGRSQAVMVLDVNRFREINSALGHQAGDEALREYADLLRTVHPRPAFAGRLGGDEFVLVLAGEDQDGDRADPNGEWLARLGERVLDQLDGPVRIRGIDIELESTAGIAAAPRDGDRLAKVLPRADAALANAKRDGARVGVWNVGMAGTVGVHSWELALHAQLRNAIAKGELVLYYQPVQEAATGRITGAEALMRWRHPERGLLPPGSFLPMAERSSLIIGLTWWELDEALAQCARWARAGLHLPVSANLSARMLVVDDLPGKIARRLEFHGLPPEMLTLEITESALVSQPTRAAAMLGELRTAGVKLSLDDFGTGYSSMEILRALPFDEMKIDKSFVADARGSLPDVAIVRSVVDLGHRLGLRVVGEGVEDEQSARTLTELGCDLLQGDVLSPPLPAAELEILLARGVDVRRDRAGAAAEPRLAFPQETLRSWERDGVRAPEPPDEPSRLFALRQYRIMDTAPEPEFDALVSLAAQLTDCGYGYLSFTDRDREWPKACHGFRGAAVQARVGPGSFIAADGRFLEIPDCTRDLRFAHLSQLKPRVMMFFAGAPLRSADGHVIGSLCVFDRVPRRLTTGQRTALDTLARHVVHLLDARLQRLLLAEANAGLTRLETLWHRQDLPAAATVCADVVRQLTHADAVAVMLPEIPGSMIFRAAGVSVVEGVRPPTELGGRANRHDERAISELAAANEPMFIADAATHPMIPADQVQRLGIASALMVPLPGDGGTQGMITARWTRPVARLDPAVRCAVTLFCGQARFTLAKLQAAAFDGGGPTDLAPYPAGDSPGSGAGSGSGAGAGAGADRAGLATAKPDAAERRRRHPATSRF